jgi:hypothetical protein
MRMMFVTTAFLVTLGAWALVTSAQKPRNARPDGALSLAEIRRVERRVETLTGGASHLDVLKHLGLRGRLKGTGATSGAGAINYHLGRGYVLSLYGDLDCVERVTLSSKGEQIRAKSLQCP